MVPSPEAASSSDNASSNELPSVSTEKPKRMRTSRPKVKTGCRKCKQRRIKCDEKRPACTQCVRSGNACPGYPPPSHSARPFEEIRIAPKPALVSQAQPLHGPLPLLKEVVLPPRRARRRAPRTAASQTGNPTGLNVQPSLSLPLKHFEGMYFSVFRAHTASGLSGYFASNFWTRRVLQECHTEAAIRHAAVALGALYKTMEQTVEHPAHRGLGSRDQRDAVMGHWRVAVRKYSEACTAMVQISNEDQKSHRTIIMASILLACFDSFIGDHRQAIIQVQNGFGLLESLQEQQGQNLLPPLEDALEDDLVTMFTRLAIQAKSYDLAFHFPEPYVVRLRAESPGAPKSKNGSPASDRPWFIPERFSSLLEARVASDHLAETSSRCLDGLFASLKDGKGILPPEWKEHGLRYKAQLEAWSAAYEPIFQSRLSPTTSPLEKAGIATLKMFSLNSHMLLVTLFTGNEDNFDYFLPHFKLVVDLGKEIVADEEKRAAKERCADPGRCTHRHAHHAHDPTSLQFSAPHIKPSFSADLGIIPPLFVVATKCRHPALRRQAIQLLRSSPRREGMWDSELVAHIATWVMNLEEAQSGLVYPPPDSTPGSEEASLKSLISSQESMPTPRQTNVLQLLIPSEKRVRIRCVDFDLRTRYADIQVGTRGANPGMPDSRFHQTHITW